uniref:Uncharacterized protein n=1 Tax=Trichogramma kaykai TaxID=54128 RepID=A0ABD2W9K6_9HYME
MTREAVLEIWKKNINPGISNGLSTVITPENEAENIKRADELYDTFNFKPQPQLTYNLQLAPIQPSSRADSDKTFDLSKIAEILNKLEAKMASFEKKLDKPRNNNNTSSSKKYDRSSSSKYQQKKETQETRYTEGMCYYHRRYAEEAKNPCQLWKRQPVDLLLVFAYTSTTTEADTPISRIQAPKFLCYQYPSFQKRSSHQSSSKQLTNVPYPILGADFVHHFDLLIDLGQAVLRTRQNLVFARGKSLPSPPNNISLLSQSHAFYDILSQFPTTYDSQFRQAISESPNPLIMDTSGPRVLAILSDWPLYTVDIKIYLKNINTKKFAYSNGNIR